MKRTLLIILLFVIYEGFSQKKDANKLYDSGVNAFNQNQFWLADSLFELSAKLDPNNDVFYNLAMTKKRLGDSCAYCENLKRASYYFDQEANRIYNLNCFRRDTLFYIKSKSKDVQYFRISSSPRCTKDFSFYYYKRNLNGNITTMGMEKDTLIKYKDADFNSQDFDIENVISERIVFTICEQMPSYPGGDDERIMFLVHNIRYPQKAKETGIQGTVYITFVVDTSGNVTDAKILRGIGGGCDEEALRVINLMPKWIPGKQSGKNVYVQYNMPVKFTLN